VHDSALQESQQRSNMGNSKPAQIGYLGLAIEQWGVASVRTAARWHGRPLAEWNGHVETSSITGYTGQHRSELRATASFICRGRNPLTGWLTFACATKAGYVGWK